MEVGYLIDVNVGPYDQPRPDGPTVARSMDAFMEEGVLAERVGFDSLHIPERHMRTECHYPAPFLLMSALAARTHRVKLATHTLVATLYHPMQIAEYAAVIDTMSRGRMILTLSMGFHDDYWRMFGMTRKDRKDRFIETVEICRLAFKGEPFSYDGKHFKLDNVQLTTPPYRPGRPEVWLGGHFAPALERAGQYGDGYCSDNFPIIPEAWKKKMDIYEASAKKHGRPRKVVILRDCWIARTREEAFATYEKYFAAEQRFYYRHGIFPASEAFPTESSVTAENLAKYYVVGSPQDCIDSMNGFKEKFGVDEVDIRFRVPLGPSFAEAKDAIQMFGEEVIPHCR